jgi:hypothetical protein
MNVLVKTRSSIAIMFKVASNDNDLMIWRPAAASGGTFHRKAKLRPTWRLRDFPRSVAQSPSPSGEIHKLPPDSGYIIVAKWLTGMGKWRIRPAIFERCPRLAV